MEGDAVETAKLSVCEALHASVTNEPSRGAHT